MLELMVYCTTIATLATIAAAVAEPAVAALGKPRRFVWLLALVMAVFYPVLAMFIRQFADAGVVVNVASSSAAAVSGAAVHIGTALPQLDGTLGIIWGLSSSLLLLFVVVGWCRLHFLAKRSPNQTVCGTRVYVTDKLGPATFGLIRPKIIIPRWVLTRPDKEVRLIISHELQHVAVLDTALMTLALLPVLLMPWNPVLWWMLRRLRFAVEADCDQRVIRNGADVSSYGQALLTVAQGKSLAPAGAIALTEPASQLEKRIKLMKANKMKHAKKWMVVALATTASLAAAAGQLGAPATDIPGIGPQRVLLAQNDQSQGDPRNISLNFSKIPVRDLINMIAEYTGENIMMHDDVEGVVTIRVEDVPWEQALDIVLANKGLERSETGGVTIIRPAS